MLDDILDIESGATLVSRQIEEDFKNLKGPELESFFDKFVKENGNLNFIEYYNRTVLDKEKINFGEFKSRWGIQGMKKDFYKYFDENYDKLKEEITAKQNIREFFEKYCTKYRNEYTFCTKLFHTILPAEFPPVDNAIRRGFGLDTEDFITSALMIRRGYEIFSEDNQQSIAKIRNVLSKEKFAQFRVNELSDMRILDMYYWFKENRE
jgi:hypothetical protein